MWPLRVRCFPRSQPKRLETSRRVVKIRSDAFESLSINRFKPGLTSRVARARSESISQPAEYVTAGEVGVDDTSQLCLWRFARGVRTLCGRPGFVPGL